MLTPSFSLAAQESTFRPIRKASKLVIRAWGILKASKGRLGACPR